MSYNIEMQEGTSGVFRVRGSVTKNIYTAGSEEACKAWIKNRKANYNRRMKHKVMTDMGLVRVRGALGGVYYE